MWEKLFHNFGPDAQHVLIVDSQLVVVLSVHLHEETRLHGSNLLVSYGFVITSEEVPWAYHGVHLREEVLLVLVGFVRLAVRQEEDLLIIEHSSIIDDPVTRQMEPLQLLEKLLVVV